MGYFYSSEPGVGSNPDGPPDDSSIVFADDFQASDTFGSKWFGEIADNLVGGGIHVETKGWNGYPPGHSGGQPTGSWAAASAGVGGGSCGAHGNKTSSDEVAD